MLIIYHRNQWYIVKVEQVSPKLIPILVTYSLLFTHYAWLVHCNLRSATKIHPEE